jgi:hypothetical protein
VVLGDHKKVPFIDRVDIHKCKNPLIFIDLCGRDLAGYNLTEQAFHGITPPMFIIAL